MGINTDAVQRLYVAYFNRPADPAGLVYWEGGLSSTTVATQEELTAIARGFSGSIEYAALYSGQTNAQVVNSLYVNLFGRPAEAAGLLHWSARIADGSETFASIALQLTYSAQGSDATAIANKLTAATAFTNALDTITEIASYFGLAAAAVARTWLATATVDGTLNTPTQVAAALTAALATLNTAVSDMIPVGSGSGGGGDSTAPTLSSSTPADDATGVAVGSNIVLTFNEAVTLGAGNIVLKKTSDDSTIETFNVAAGTGSAGGTVTANGTAVTINPFANLSTSTGYYVTVADTAVRDAAGNPYAGITSTTVLSFTAVDAPIALVTLTTGVDVRTGGTGNDTLTGHFDHGTPANTTLNAGDTITGGLGTDTLTLTTPDSLGPDLTLADAFFTGVTGFEVLVIDTTVSDNQVITAGTFFEAAFATGGIDLTTVTAAGNITIDMNSFPFTGDAIFRTTSVAGIQTITAGSGATTVISVSAAGNQNISGAGLANVTSESTTGTQTIVTGTGIAAMVVATSSTGPVSVTTSSLADSVNLTTADVGGPGNFIDTGAGDDTITLDAGTAVAAQQNTITGGTGADTINLNVNASKDVIVIGDTDSGITVATADSITNFTTANDSLKMGVVADGANYLEAGVAVANFDIALANANTAMNSIVMYSFQWVATTNGYLFVDNDLNGTADQVVVLVGIVGTTIEAADVIA